jgi:hypothetical protein
VRSTLIGLVAVSLLFAGACGDDDDGGASGSDQGGLLGQAGGSDGSGGDGGDGGDGDGGSPLGGDGSAYPEQVQEAFMGGCTSQPGANEETCRCALDAIMASVPYEDYTAYEESLGQGGSSSELGTEIFDAITSCMA